MQVLKLLHKQITDACECIHQSRLVALLSAVDGLLRKRQLSLAGLGRALDTQAKPKHAIKRMDRLIGNVHLWSERTLIYRYLSQQILRPKERPVIIIDWSDVTADRNWQLLRAAVPVNGRTLTLYEEVHPLSVYDNPKVRHRFLQCLQSLLPACCRPIVVTDAGFRTTWFAQLNALGWDWVGRVRGRTHYRPMTSSAWQGCKTLYRMATNKPRYVGEVELAQYNPLRCALYLVKQKPKGRQRRTCRGTRARGGHSLKCEQRAREPWLLITSLGKTNPHHIMKLYQLRMQIEQGFRDMKNPRLGFYLRSTRTTQADRLAILILINTLATWVAWLIGKMAEARALHRQFQANTTRDRKVLSTFFLGVQIYQQQRFEFYREEIAKAIQCGQAYLAEVSSA